VENCAEVMGQLHIRGITEKHAAITKTAISINTHLGEFVMHFLEEAKKWIGEVSFSTCSRE